MRDDFAAQDFALKGGLNGMLHSSGLIEWDPAYSVGIPSIDEQHRLLVSIIRHLEEAMMEGRTREVIVPLFEATHRYTKFHFEYEERLFQEHEYSEAQAHSERHAELIAQLYDFETRYLARKLVAGAPLVQFLHSWLFDHIGAEDKKYSALLKEKDVS